MAVRAGYGIFYEHGTSYEANTGSLIGSVPLTLSQTELILPPAATNAWEVMGPPRDTLQQLFRARRAEPSDHWPVALRLT